MKKLWIALLAVALVWTLAPAAQAADNLAMSGSMRVVYHHINTDDGSTPDSSYFDQRLRVGGTFTAAEGVTADMRFDLGEGKWGRDYDWSRWGWAQAQAGKASINVDRAYLTVDKEMWKLWAGKKWHGHGQYLMWDAQTTGLNMDVKLKPVNITLHYSKLDENGALHDEDNVSLVTTAVACPGPTCVVSTDTNTEDSDLYGIVLKYSHEAFNLGAMFAAIQDNSNADDSPWGFGVFGDTKMGPVNLSGEFDFFGGDYNVGGVQQDYVGFHGMLDANMQALDNLLIGGMFWYAAGTTDANERQATCVIGGGETFAPLDWRGPLYDFGYPLGSVAGGTGSSRGGAMDLGGANTGVIGGQLYADWTIIEPLVGYLHVGYAVPNEDANTFLDSVMVIAAQLDYRLAERTSLNVGYLYTDFEWDAGVGAGAADDAGHFITKLQVNF